ncbi:MAG: serpin family protein [Demequinaceae bacterium]|nr:serpin family protein [Demequinaceae bacterium]
MKAKPIAAASLVAALTLSACSSSATSDPYPPYSDPIVVRPAADSPDAGALAAALNDVGFRLFQDQAGQADGDIVLSPLSIGIAFGMLDLGATGVVADALEDLFGYPVDGDDLWSAFNTLERVIVTEPDAASSETDTRDPIDNTDEWSQAKPNPPIVRIANREFYDTDFVTVDGYDDALMKWFGAGVEPLPLRTDSEGSRKHINSWVEDKTMGLIPDLIPEGAISEWTVMVLVNALYLKAEWASQFDADLTADGPFTRLDGSISTTPFMHEPSLSTTAMTGDGYTAFDLPYAEGDLSMLVVVPDSGRYSEIEAQLDSGLVADIDAGLESAILDLYFPSFESEYDFNLRDAIEGGLGVSNLFDVPDLRGIGEDVAVTDAVHAAKIIVDENGTEAAAATAIIMDLTAMPADGTEVKVDRPFLYLIRDNVTGAVLFLGRVLDPSA